ncbi:CCHC-type domain-containing protein [Trichonephila clavipes]|nr:CCHC-type domain-containing protein [Trichonephila clavipes]
MANPKNRNSTRKSKFKGNRYTIKNNQYEINKNVRSAPTASERKLQKDSKMSNTVENEDRNVIINLEILSNVISLLCCPECLENKLQLLQESVFGLASNMILQCKNCNFLSSFCTSMKVNKLHNINLSFVFGLRIIGKGHSAAMKLCSAINVKSPSKTAFKYLEKKLEHVSNNVAYKTMNEAAAEIHEKNNFDEVVQCGVSVDGTWQRRGHLSLNGCVSAISIDTGKVLDMEVMSKMCRFCLKKHENRIAHECEKHVGSSGAMEPVGVYRIFERSAETRKLQYVHFYGDGDSKSFDAVKNIYGENSVKKFECIGHIQKRVGSRLRKLKLKQKGLGGRGKLTDSFIDKLQNYYGIAIRSNVINIEKKQ